MRKRERERAFLSTEPVTHLLQCLVISNSFIWPPYNETYVLTFLPEGGGKHILRNIASVTHSHNGQRPTKIIDE
jgi:hypothetical protein